MADRTDVEAVAVDVTEAETYGDIVTILRRFEREVRAEALWEAEWRIKSMRNRCTPEDMEDARRDLDRPEVQAELARLMSLDVELPSYMHPCPKCGAMVDCGDRKDGARIRCKACGHRATFRHVGDRKDCEPGDHECWESKHWRLGNGGDDEQG